MAIAYVRDLGQIATDGTTQTSSASFAATPSVNDTIIVGCSDWFSGQAGTDVMTATDNQTPANTYTNDKQEVDGGTSGTGKSIASILSSKVVTASGTFTITMDAPGTSNTFYTWTAVEFSGVALTTPLDLNASTSLGTGAGTLVAVGPTAALTHSNEVIFLAHSINSSLDHTPQTTADFTIIANVQNGATLQIGLVGYIVQNGNSRAAAVVTWATALTGTEGVAAAIATYEGLGPNITAQPTSQTVWLGQTATFTITATGTGTLHYQWKDDGANVGTDSSTYAPTPVLADNGSVITCVVTDDNGSTTSTNAYLYVLGSGSYAWTKA